MAALEEWTDDSESEPEQMGEIPDVSEDDEDDEVLEKPKAPPKPEKPPDDPTISKKTGRPKKKLSQKQLDALAKGRANRDAGRAQRKTIKQENEVVKKKRREQAIVKKAVRIKKREVMEEAALELSSEGSEDELEIKQVKRAVAKKRAKKKVAAKKTEQISTPAQPAFVFY